MWSMFRKDLAELVSTVREDTSSLLSNLDHRYNDDDQNGDDYEEQQEQDIEGQEDNQEGVNDHKHDNEVPMLRQEQDTMKEDAHVMNNNKDDDKKSAGVNGALNDDDTTTLKETSFLPDANEATTVAANDKENEEASTDNSMHNTTVNDKILSIAEREAIRRMELEETYTTSLLGGYVEEGDDDNTTKEYNDEEYMSKMMQVGKQKEQVEEPHVDEDDPDYYDKKRMREIRHFIQHFNIDDKTNEIAIILQDNEIVKEYFELLVPQHVTYYNFWIRYYYRCHDVSRIEQELRDEDDMIRRTRSEAIQKVSKFIFGGAVSAVTSVVWNNNQNLTAKTTPNAATAATTSSVNREGTTSSFHLPLLGTLTKTSTTASTPTPSLFQKAVAAVMDINPDDEEEELGWDDDDDDLDLALDASKKDVGHDIVIEELVEEAEEEETITFKDVALEKTQDELKIAIEERDQLHDTIELQKHELMTLQKQIEEYEKERLIWRRTQQHADDDNIGGASQQQQQQQQQQNMEYISEIEHLKLRLFEKESELEAMKQSVDDHHIEKRYDDGNDRHNNNMDQEQLQVLQNELKQANDTIMRYETEIIEYKELVKAKDDEIDEMLTAMQHRKNEFEEEIMRLRGEIKFLQSNIDATQADSQYYIDELKEVNEQYRQQMETNQITIQEKDNMIIELRNDITTLEEKLHEAVVSSTSKMTMTTATTTSSTASDTTTDSSNMSSIVHVGHDDSSIMMTTPNEKLLSSSSAAPAGTTMSSSVTTPLSFSTGSSTTNTTPTKLTSLLATKITTSQQGGDEDDNSDWGDDW